MDIFDVLTLLGGLALFLYGMEVMGDGLKQRAGSKLKVILERLTTNPFKGFLLGLIVTGIIQSSSATTVMVVGFVNSGIMKLRQAIGVIIGANVGTSVTAWILSLTGIQGDSFLVSLFKPSSFSPILGIIGIALHLFSKSNRRKTNGTILLGFTVLMYGMEIMSGAVAGLAEVPAFAQTMVMFSNPILGLLAGLILTAIIQSSSASVGILQAISLTGIVTYGSAIPIIMGENIGTCVTALLSSIGTKRDAKRAAMVHLYFNIIGTAVFMTLFYILNAIIGFSFVNDSASPLGIAIVHTSFKLFSTALLLPLSGLLERLACFTIRDTQEEKEFQLLEDRFLSTPSFAVAQCRTVTNAMAELSRQTLFQSMQLTHTYHEAQMQSVMTSEDKVDTYEDKIGTYLIKLSSQKLTMKDSREVSKLLHCIGDFERISDHAVNIAQAAEEIHIKKIAFSPKASQGLDVMYAAVEEITNLAINAFISQDLQLAFMVEPLEQVVDLLKAQLKAQHIERLQTGECTTELGFVFSDLLTNYERVADHCSNIAVCLIQVEQDSFDTHEYLNSVKTSNNAEFLKLYEQYKEKYALPK